MRTSGPRVSPVLLRFAFFFMVLIAVFFLNIGVGSSGIGLGESLRILLGHTEGNPTNSLIILKIRLPRALGSIAGGASLGVAGLLLQTFFNNPIVDPYILGISSGSMFCVGMAVLGGYTFGFKHITPWVLCLAAFAGAVLVMLVILFAVRRVKNMVSLLVIGLMTGFLCGGGTSILSAFAEKERIAHFAVWSMGSFSGFTWSQIHIQYSIILPLLAGAFFLAKPLNALHLGEHYAQSMGVPVKRIRYLLLLVSSLLTAVTVAFAGPVSFIGLAIPHICRVLFHTANARILIPAAILGGALVAGICDFIARTIIAPMEIPLGAVTALAGAPLVVWLLTRKNALT